MCLLIECNYFCRMLKQICTLLILIPFVGMAQIDFPDYLGDYSLTPEQLEIIDLPVENMGTESAELILHLPQLYGIHRPFSSPDSHLILAAGGRDTFRIHFQSDQNLDFDSYVFLEKLNEWARPIEINAQVRYSNSYYSSTFNKLEQDLKNSLHNLIDGHQSLGYNSARDAMFMNIDNKKNNGQGASQNTLECPYTGRQAIGYSNRQDAQNNFSFNTEHTYPQSMFGGSEPMKSDMYHLYPTDATSNSQRGNLPFGVVSNPSWTEGGSKKNSSAFEPRDQHKGPVSRAMMYFVIRYGNMSNFLSSQESILRSWHSSYLPDAAEQRRNDDINALQGNRNPFIDFPQFIERINSLSRYSKRKSPELNAYPSIVALDTIDRTDSIHIHLYNAGDTTLNNLNASASNGSFNAHFSNTTLSMKQFIRCSFTPSKSGLLQDTIRINAEPSGSGQNTVVLSVYVRTPSSSLESKLEKLELKDVFDGQFVHPPRAGTTLSLRDLNGRLLSISSNFDTDYLPRGMYFLQIEQDQESYSFKLPLLY